MPASDPCSGRCALLRVVDPSGLTVYVEPLAVVNVVPGAGASGATMVDGRSGVGFEVP
jgi:hypothetical protein